MNALFSMDPALQVLFLVLLAALVGSIIVAVLAARGFLRQRRLNRSKGLPRRMTR